LFSGLIHDAREAATHLVLRYVARASVAVPFIIALGFAIAAIAVMLVDRFGHVTAYWIMAGGLALVGVLAALAVSLKEREEQAAEEKAQRTDTQAMVSEATAQAMVQAPMALLGALFTTPGGATSAFKVARLLGRNLPLVLLLVMMGALFWPAPEGNEEEVQIDEAGARVNGLGPPSDVYH
jgi:MFS family permease